MKREGQQKRKPKNEESVGNRERRGERKEEEEKKNMNDLWVYEKQHVSNAFTSDCFFFVFLSHRCHQMTKYRIRIQAQICEPQSWKIIDTHCLKTKI